MEANKEEKKEKKEMRNIGPPEKKPRGKSGHCSKCGFVLRADGSKARTHLWPKESLVLYCGKFLCLYHYSQELRSEYKESWKAEELERYREGENVPWTTEAEDKS